MQPLQGELVDVTVDAGLDAVHWEPPALYEDLPCGQGERMTGGVAVGDVDGDGDLDLYLPRMDLPGRLLLNDGDGGFTAQPAIDSAFAASGAAFGDVDGDGALDLLVTPVRDAPPRLYMQRNGGFVEEGAARGLEAAASADCGLMYSAAFGDPDRDGDLDVLLAQWEDGPYSERSGLWINDGEGRFSEAAGLDLTESASFSGAMADMDGDGTDELLVAGDWGTSRLYRQVSGEWVDRTAAAGVGTDDNGMGMAIGDVDGDGVLDWFVSAIYDDRQLCTVQGGWECTGNRLYLGQEDGTFVDGTDDWGVRDGGWGWGAALVDLDADGRLDLAQTGGFSLTPWPDGEARFGEDLAYFGERTARLWHHRGDSMVESGAEVGWTDRADGRALVAFDKDGDGDQDLLVVHNADPPTLLENRLEQGEWLILDGLPAGTRVVVDRRGAPDLLRVVPGGGTYLANLAPPLHIGLGEAPATRITVTWPDGAETVLDAPESGRVHVPSPP